jgi:hypothetical protein
MRVAWVHFLQAAKNIFLGPGLYHARRPGSNGVALRNELNIGPHWTISWQQGHRAT